MLAFDRRGRAAVALISEEFRTGADAWREIHGFDAAAVYVRHPIQPLGVTELHGRADEIFDEVVAAISR